jgi:hypothetical protein
MGNCNNCVQQQTANRTSLTSTSSFDNLSHSFHRNRLTNRLTNTRTLPSYNLNALIDETLLIIRTVVDTDQEPPHAMLIVSRIANREDRWLEVMIALIERIPMNDPLGATVIALLLDECSLPSKELLQQLIRRICSNNRSKIKMLQSIIDEHINQNSKQLENCTISSSIETHVGQVTNIGKENEMDINETTPTVNNHYPKSKCPTSPPINTPDISNENLHRERNTLVVLGCLAEKLGSFFDSVKSIFYHNYFQSVQLVHPCWIQSHLNI